MTLDQNHKEVQDRLTSEGKYKVKVLRVPVCTLWAQWKIWGKY